MIKTRLHVPMTYRLEKWSEIQDAIHKLEDHIGEVEDNMTPRYRNRACQVRTNANQVTAGATVIDFPVEDVIDGSHFTHPADSQVVIQRDGRYRVTYKVVSDEGHRTRTLINAVVDDRGTAWDQ